MDLTACEIKNKIANKEVSALEVTKTYLDNAIKRDGQVNGYLRLMKDSALKCAEEIDRKVNNKEPLGQLAGVPIAIKDNICIKGDGATCSSRILENYISPYDATVINKIKENDGIIIGKTNLDEFAMGSSTENSYFKTTKNPWAFDRVPGGSSGGSAAVIGAREASLALGSDTGGSIRQPASLCGVVGLKPTYGRVSRYGLVAFASSLDQIGPLTTNIKDAALMLNTISGYDRRDSTSINMPVPDYVSNLKNDVKGVRIGIPKEYFIDGLESCVENKVNASIDVLKGLGAEIVDVSLPHTEYAVAAYYIIATAEASSNLARYDGVQYGYRSGGGKAASDDLIAMYEKTRAEGFGSEVKRRIILGTYVLSSGYYDAYYLKAQRARTLLKNDFDDAFKKCDCILTPTSATTAFKIGERSDNPLQMYLSDIFTISVNLAGIPAISVPCGNSKDNLPVGLQIMGKHFDEQTILNVAYAFEQNTDHCKNLPELVTS